MPLINKVYAVSVSPFSVYFVISVSMDFISVSLVLFSVSLILFLLHYSLIHTFACKLFNQVFMKKIFSDPSSWIGLLLVAAAMILGSCQKDEYSPVSATKQLRGILIAINSEREQESNLLDNKEFVAGISAFGNESQAIIPCQTKRVKGKTYLFIEADMPDIKNMKFSNDRKQGTATTEITLKVNKEKVDLKCYFQYKDDSKPLMITGSKTSITLESITLNKKTVKRNGKTVIGGNLVCPLQMDDKGKLH